MTTIHFSSTLNKLFAIGLLNLFLFSCSEGTEKTIPPQNTTVESTDTEPPASPSFNAEHMSVETFEIKDTVSGKSKGWGYNILADGRVVIHQPILPGISGNQPFSTEQKAKKTADFALNKMKATGSLPTIGENELDSLGVLK